MEENLWAISLVVVFTLIYSCSDNKRQKRIDRDLQKVVTGVNGAWEMLSANQIYLEKSLDEIKSKQLPKHTWMEDKFWTSHAELIESHRGLLERTEKLILSTSSEDHPLNGSMRNSQNRDLEKKEILMMHVQIVDLMRQSRKCMSKHKSMKTRFDKYVKNLMLISDQDKSAI
jgi:hypothetical protein